MFLYFLPGNLSRGMLCPSYTLSLSPLHNPNYFYPHLFGISGRRRETGRPKGQEEELNPSMGGGSGPWIATAEAPAFTSKLNGQDQRRQGKTVAYITW